VGALFLVKYVVGQPYNVNAREHHSDTGRESWWRAPHMWDVGPNMPTGIAQITSCKPSAHLRILPKTGP